MGNILSGKESIEISKDFMDELERIRLHCFEVPGSNNVSVQAALLYSTLAKKIAHDKIFVLIKDDGRGELRC